MPKQPKRPRLWLEDRGPGRGKQWTILDSGRKIRTGCAESRIVEAEQKLAAYLTEKHQVSGECCSAKVSIADVLLHYVRHGSGSATTRFSIARLDDFFAERSVSEIKGNLCRQYLTARLKQGVQESTVRRELGVLSTALKFYHGEFGLDPLPEVILPPEGQARDTWMTRTEFARALWAAWRRPECKHLVRYMLISIYSGTRPAAIMKLRWLPSPTAGYADLENGILYRRGSGERETKKRRPPSRIHVRLLAHMKRWHAADMDAGITHVVHFRGKPIKSIKRSWQLVRESIGLPKEYIPYSLKHTAATWLMQRGIDRWEAAGYLGISAEVLENVYAHHDPNFQRNAAGLSTKVRR